MVMLVETLAVRNKKVIGMENKKVSAYPRHL